MHLAGCIQNLSTNTLHHGEKRILELTAFPCYKPCRHRTHPSVCNGNQNPRAGDPCRWSGQPLGSHWLFFLLHFLHSYTSKILPGLRLQTFFCIFVIDKKFSEIDSRTPKPSVGSVGSVGDEKLTGLKCWYCILSNITHFLLHIHSVYRTYTTRYA